MGYPNIPDINPNIDIDREEVIDLLLASIGLEELGLAHLVNAEAEKLQRALGTLTLPGATTPIGAPLATTLDDLLRVNRDVTKMLKFAMHKEFILLAKLQDVIEFAQEFTPPTPPLSECPCSIRGNRGTNQGASPTAVITVNPGPGQIILQSSDITYNINLCGQSCNENVNIINFHFRTTDPTRVFNFTAGRAEVITACDPTTNTATVTGTIRRGGNVYDFTLVISNNGRTLNFTATNQEAPFDVFNAVINPAQGAGPLVAIDPCNG
ncbi:hypothetical protein [Bacillus badius]|uniref:hypothetical protein n=1 Tax=Bacillus badius TaxID=1455 RepID=UPI0005AE0190|nr:hypothetical protein [Bacillus badius]KIL74718.1 hypothetical protein SD78_1787 [Bacillus badius]